MPEKVLTGYPSIDRIHLKGIPEETLNPKVYPYSMFKTFLLWNKNRMDQTCVYDSFGDHTKRELDECVRGYIRLFLLIGIEPGRSRIAVAMPNSFTMVSLVMAANAIGVGVFFLDYSESNETLVEQAKDERRECSLIFVRDGFIRVNLSTAFVINYDDLITNACFAISSDVVSEMIDEYSEYDESLIFLQTSGSTSVPKILPFKNSAIYATMLAALNSTGIDNYDPVNRRLMTILSARLPFGFMTGFIPVLWGMEVAFASGASPAEIAKYYEYKAFLIFGTPVLLQAIMKLTPEDADFSPLYKFYSSGLPTPEDLFPAAIKFFREHNNDHVKICNNYGFGEGLGIGTASDKYQHLEGTNGKLYYSADWVIVDEAMKEVKYGDVGELICSSSCLCDGYWCNPEETAKKFVSFRGRPFFMTGDFVSLDENGYVSVRGRKTRFYQPTGALDKVSCDMLEEMFRDPEKLSFVGQVAVVPITEDDGTVFGKAFVVLKPGRDPEYCKILIEEHLRAHLKDFQIPKQIIFLEELPLKNGKINYQLLQSM